MLSGFSMPPMKKIKYPLLGILFLLTSLLFITNYRSLLTFLPSQEVELSNGAAFGPLVKDYLFVQEITLQKRHLNKIDVCLGKMPGQNANENIFLLLDSSHRILYTKRFTSQEIDGVVYYPFVFSKSFDLGKGNKVYACIYSLDGEMNNSLALPRKTNSKLGKLYVIPLQNNDVIRTIENQQSVIPFEGSMGLKTFESDSLLFSPLRIVLYLLVLLFTLSIVFFRKVRPFILKSVILPEYAFLTIAIVFGLLMVVVTPPFQVPDEPSHLYRSYQVSELNIFKYKDVVPQSLVQLSAMCNRMKFMAHEKTSKAEILALDSIGLNPEIRTYAESTNYTLPYLPQAFGIFIGRVFNLQPLWMFYLGRLFNLLVSVVLLFLAIRITPVLKWLFFLLGVMPMTLYQMASLSYDAMTISLSFLLVATVLNFALNKAKVIRTRDLLMLFLIVIFLAAAKPPYYILAFTFLIVPVKKLGSWLKFSLVLAGLTITVILFSQFHDPGRKFFEKFSGADKPSVTAALAISDIDSRPEEPLPAPLPSAPQNQPQVKPPETKAVPVQNPPQAPAAEQKPAQADQPAQTAQPNQPPQMVPYDPFDAPAQQNFILEDPIRYIGIIADTFTKFIGLYQISFIGLFGWVDTPLPPFVVYGYLILLMIVALTSGEKGIKINLLQKGIFLALFLIGYVLVETAMYLYCNPVGCNPITAVQGRYFIAFGPLLFLLFYNNLIGTGLDRAFSSPQTKPIPSKGNQKKKTDVKAFASEPIYTKLLPWFVIGFAIFALVFSIYWIMARFYIVLI